jgi:hypothetical protein
MNAMDSEAYEKLLKDFYGTGKKPAILALPPLPYIMVDGQGDPNTSADFAAAIEALYGFSYTLKFLPKKGVTPEGYFPYKVSALEGLWDMPPGVDYTLANKDQFVWTAMILQPGFVTEALFEEVRALVKQKKDAAAADKLRFCVFAEGLCCQMLHTGPYDAEPATFAQMMEFAQSQGYRRTKKGHHEIYMSDTRKTAPEKLKTLLRFAVEKA